MAKLSEMHPDDAKDSLYNAYMQAHAAYTNDPDGTEGKHPSKDVARWREAAAGETVEDRKRRGRDADMDDVDAEDDEDDVDAEDRKRRGRDADMDDVDAEDRKRRGRDADMDDVDAEDNPPPTKGTNRVGGKPVGQDGRFEISAMDGSPRFTYKNGKTVTGDAAIEANARTTNPARIDSMASQLKGYRRL